MKQRKEQCPKQLYPNAFLEMTVFFGYTQHSEAIPEPKFLILKSLTGSKKHRPVVCSNQAMV